MYFHPKVTGGFLSESSKLLHKLISALKLEVKFAFKGTLTILLIHRCLHLRLPLLLLKTQNQKNRTSCLTSMQEEHHSKERSYCNTSWSKIIIFLAKKYTYISTEDVKFIYSNWLLKKSRSLYLTFLTSFISSLLVSCWGLVPWSELRSPSVSSLSISSALSIISFICSIKVSFSLCNMNSFSTYKATSK